MAMLYGGIDSKEVTERAADPSGAMGAIQRILANDVACKHVARDFARPPAERRLFPGIEPDVLPGHSAEATRRSARPIVHLHERILGRYDAADSAGGRADVRAVRRRSSRTRSEQKGLDKQENYHCRPQQGRPDVRRPTRTTRSAPGAAW